MACEIHVIPVATVRGWDGRTSDPPVKAWPAVPLSEALDRRWTVDAHAYSYRTPDGIGGFLPRQPRIKKSALPRMQKRGMEPALVVVFAEYDTRPHIPWESPKAAKKALKTLLKAVQGGALKGAGGYTTRAGLRLVWELERPLPVTFASSYLTALHRRLPVVPGLHLDPSCAQWHRCYRLPYVVRDGYATDPYVDFGDMAPLAWMPSEPLVREGAHAAADREHADPPDAPPTPTPDVWAALQNKLSKRLYTALLLGTPLAGKGERNTAMLRTAGKIAFALKCEDPAAIYGAMYRAVSADGSEGAPSLSELWDACCRIADGQAGQNAERAKAPAPDVSAGPPIVRIGPSFFVKDRATGDYRPAVDGVGLVAELEKHGPQGIQTRGKTSPLSPARILADVGVNAQRVVYEMGRKQAQYREIDGGTMALPACVPREIPAVRDERVARWLDLLGGELSPVLLDWLAALPRLEFPTAALYLEGPPSVGKGLLALSCAHLWADGAVPFEEATGQWTIGLRDCPVVHLDEGIKRDDRRQASTAFRSLVGESVHVISEKYRPTAVLKGCPRVIITANSSGALPLTGQHSWKDLQAVVRRILYIEADNRAARYLADIGGRATTEGWARSAVPRHLRWLAENREFKRGNRFLVEGIESRYHRDLLILAGINADILAAIAHHVAGMGRPTGGDGDGGHPGIRLPGDGTVLVHVGGLRRRWTTLLGETPPSEASVGAALRDLSQGHARASSGHGRPSQRYYVLPGALVLRAANRLCISDGDELWAKIAGKPLETQAQGGQGKQ